jgi:hypothetical protein
VPLQAVHLQSCGTFSLCNYENENYTREEVVRETIELFHKLFINKKSRIGVIIGVKWHVTAFLRFLFH